MTDSPNGEARAERVLVLAPTSRDSAASLSVLASARLEAVACDSLDALCREIEAGAGVVLLTEEAVARDMSGCLSAVIRKQPAWSDLPLVILTAGGTDSPAAALAFETLGNVTLLDRPVRLATLVSAVRAALRARRKQYEVRDHLAERTHIAQTLRKADRRKNEFLAMLAHELRNPLAPIRNAIEVMRLCGLPDGPIAKSHELIERQVVHMARLIDDLLDVSRITWGKFELRKERVNLAAVVERAAEATRPFLDQRHHLFTTELTSETLVMEADPDRLEQVVTNLLTNAGKYTPPGGRITLSLTLDGGDAVIRVRDNGIGLRPDTVDQLFDLFVQVDRVPGRVAEGLGLGLTLVKTLTEMHGGTVAAASDGPGLGSEFVVRLPLPTVAPARRTAVDSVAAPAPHPSLRVLVVEDNEDGAASLAEVLQWHHHIVEVTHTGMAALATAPSFRPDVILLDVGLPGGMDGYEVARRLRSNGFGSTPIIAVTGFGQAADRRRSAEAGFTHHLVKPVDPAELAKMLAHGG